MCSSRELGPLLGMLPSVKMDRSGGGSARMLTRPRRRYMRHSRVARATDRGCQLGCLPVLKNVSNVTDYSTKNLKFS